MRKTYTIAAALLTLSPLLWAQQNLKQPAPALPAEILGPPLVVWSAMQQPRPIPATAPSDNGTSETRADSARSDQPRYSQSQTSQPADSQPQQPSSQTFIGTILSEADK
jgi:hypothetical protein